MFERFTKDARHAVVQAQEEARNLGHGHIGSGHLLLGLVTQDDGVAARALGRSGLTVQRYREAVADALGTGHDDLDAEALRAFGIELDDVRRKVEESFGQGALDRSVPPAGRPRGHIPFTKGAKKVLEIALREALALKHNYIGTEHILLATTRDQGGTGATALRTLGFDLAAIRTAVRDELSLA